MTAFDSPLRARTRRTSRFSRVLAGVLGGALVLSAATLAQAPWEGSAHAEEASTTEGLVAWYKLDETSGTVAADSSGNGRTAAVEGTASWNGGQGFTFGGGNTSSGNAIKLPNNLIAGLGSITVSADVLVDPTLTGSHFVFNLGNRADVSSAQMGYLFYTTTAYQAKISDGNWSNEKTTSKGSDLAKGIWKHLTYTQTGTTGTLYEDGVQVAQNTAVTITPAQIGGGLTSRNYIGRSAYNGDVSFKGKVRDFRVYNRALAQPEIATLSTETGAADLAAAASAVTLATGTPLTANITVPTASSTGATVAWSSSKPSVLSSTGRVIRPSTAQDAQVTLTAKISLRGQSVTKEFPFTVVADPSNDGKVEADVAAIDLGELSSVTGDLALPTAGSRFAAPLAWTSSDPSVISDAGAVTRPRFGQPDASVRLTVTGTLNGAQATRSFTATVPAQDRNGSGGSGLATRTAVTVAAPTLPLGTGTTATAVVTASDAGEIVGSVDFRAGSWHASVPLSAGASGATATATATLPATLPLGTTEVTASYAGYRQLPASTGIATVTTTDVTVPVTTATVSAKDRTVSLSAKDASSAVTGTEYRVGRTGQWAQYTGAIVVGDDETVVYFRSTDAAGNTEHQQAALVPDRGTVLAPSTLRVVAVTTSRSHGSAGSISVRVEGKGAAPSGTVRVTSDDVLLGEATVVSGRATVALPADAAVGAHDLALRYSGDRDYTAATASSRYTVTKATSRTKATLAARSVSTKARAKATVTVTAQNAVTPKGTATVTVKRGGKTVRTLTVAVSAKGTGSVTLPKLAKGKYSLTVRYRGTAQVAASTATTSLTVKG